ncbi:glucuronokinase [Ranunculus cassubicifolius]
MRGGIPNLLEKLRPLVGFKNWDYCVLWRLSNEETYIEWAGCCCGGAADTNTHQNIGEELLFHVSPVVSCKDAMFQHPRSKSCDLLAQLPSSMPIDSGTHAETLISSQPRWINLQGTVGTRVLIPVSGGLVELFLTKQVSEDPHLIEFVMGQCNVPWDQINGFPMNANGNESNFFQPNGYSSKPPRNLWGSPASTTSDNLYSPWGISLDHNSLHSSVGQPRTEKDFIKQEDSAPECSDLIEDEDQKDVGGGKKHQSKNLLAERRRRKKLNDRLFTLRSIVPNISKMDKASILGDAIKFVKELQTQVTDLEAQLDEPYDENGCTRDKIGARSEDDESLKVSQTRLKIPTKKNKNRATAEKMIPQMEPQVEVTKIDDKEFFLKVFCEHKPGGFVRLMEAMSSLALEVTNANVFRVETLVMNVFKVQKRDNNTIQEDFVRDSLFEVACSSIGEWPNPYLDADNKNNADYNHRCHLHTLSFQA